MNVANKIGVELPWPDPASSAETHKPPFPSALPLVLDLDGTLLRTDLLDETFVAVLRRDPLSLPRLVGAALRGRAALKQELAARAEIDLDTVQIDDRVAAFVTEAKA